MPTLHRSQSGASRFAYNARPSNGKSSATASCGARVANAAFPAFSAQISFLDAHLRAFAHCGGVPQRTVYDNLSAAVRRVQFPKRAMTVRFQPLASHYLLTGAGRVGPPATLWVRGDLLEGQSPMTTDAIQQMRPHRHDLGYQKPFTYPLCSVCRLAFEKPDATATEATEIRPLLDPALLLWDLELQVDSIPRNEMQGYLLRLKADPHFGYAFAEFAAKHGFDLGEPSP